MDVLNQDELATLRSSWDVYLTNIESNGNELFIRLFDENPTFIAWFPKFNWPEKELRGNDAVIRNGISDLEFVSKIIDSLVEQSPEETRKLIRKQAGCHNSHKVTEGMFDRMRLCVLGELNDKLGPNVMTDATQAAWHKFFKVYIAALYPA